MSPAINLKRSQRSAESIHVSANTDASLFLNATQGRPLLLSRPLLSTPTLPRSSLPRPKSHLQHRPVGVVVRDPVGKRLQALLDRRLRLPVQKRLRLRNVRVGARHVPRLRGELLNLRGDVHGLRDSGNEVFELSRLRAAEVDDFVFRVIQILRATEALHNPIHDVADERVVAARGAVAVHGDGLVRQKLPGKLVDRQVRPLARAVHREEAQAVHVNVVEVVEGVRQQLAGALRRGVGRDRFFHPVVLREGHLVVVAVDRRGRAIDERVDVVLLGHLQHRLRAAHVRPLIGHGGFDRGAYAGLRGEVDDRIHVPGVQGVQDRVGIADVRLDQGKRVGREVLDSLLFHGAGVEGIEVVDGRDAVTVAKEAAAEVPADEAGPAGYADVHCILWVR